MEWNKRILIGTIGYHNLSNHSVGPILFDKIQEQDWFRHVSLEEMNWGPIAIVQWFQDLDTPFDRLVLVTAIQREGRKIGDFTLFKWCGKTPSDQEIQARIGDAVTGVISPENLLVIGEHFKIWPGEVILFDIEPGPEKAGPTLTTEVGERVMEYLEAIKEVSAHGLKSGFKIVNLYGDQLPV